MDPRQFHSAAAGRVVRTPQGYHAFIPAPLPLTPERLPLAYDDELVLALSEADAALSELSGVGSLLPNPHLLVAPYTRLEAERSSRIEGTRATLSDLFQDELGLTPPDGLPSDVREVRNYVEAMEHGLRRLSSLPLSLRLVRELHERLMTGVRGDHLTPGEFRRSQNWIGSARDRTPETAAYVPPPVDAMNEALDNWERFIHERGRYPDLIQCAVMHARFEVIHPFLDGNGRVGRLLITLFLVERGRLTQPLLYLSDFIERHRNEYYDALARVSTHNDWRGWLSYFLTGVAQAAGQGIRQARVLLALRERYRLRLEQQRQALRLVEQLFLNPFVTARLAADGLEVTAATANKAIMALVEAGILTELTGRAWGRVFVAEPILRAIQEPPSAPPEDHEHSLEQRAMTNDWH